jgi:hypothetical protein
MPQSETEPSLMSLNGLITRIRKHLVTEKKTPQISDRMDKLTQYETTSKALDAEEENVKRDLRTKLKQNPNYNTSAEKRKLARIKTRRGNIEKFIRLLDNQNEAIEMKRDANDLMRTLGAGNAELRALHTESTEDSGLDLDQIKEDYDELLGDTIEESQAWGTEFVSLNALDDMSLNATTDSGETVGDSIDAEIENLRQSIEHDVNIQNDYEQLEMASLLPTVEVARANARMSPSAPVTAMRSAPVLAEPTGLRASTSGTPMRSGAGPLTSAVSSNAPRPKQHDDLDWLMDSNKF